MVASTSLPTLSIPHAHAIHAVRNIYAKLSLAFLHVPDFKSLANMILRRACETLPLSKLEFLSISSHVMTQPISWGEVFQRLTEVTTVKLYGHGTISLLQAITPPRGKGRKRGRGDNCRGPQWQTPNNNSLSALVLMPIFPKLTSLLLEKLDFTHVVPGSGVLYDLILNAVKRRRAKKPLVSAMCITRCAISAEEAVALEEIVRDFWWSYDKCIDIDLDEDGDGDWDSSDPG